MSKEQSNVEMPKTDNPIQKIKNTLAWKCLGEITSHSFIIHTPLVHSSVLAEVAGITEVYFKAEYLQTGGSFKIRGALHKLQRLQKSKKSIVFTASAGNHGIGLALAARALGITAVIHVPDNTPEIKKKKIRDAEAILEVGGMDFCNCEKLARVNCDKKGGVYISSFDDDYIISGNGGAVASEICSALAGDLSGVDILCPVGGGGMASGLAAYFHETDARVFGVEPENDCAMYNSMRANCFQEAYVGQGSLADGLSGSISQRTYDICRSGLFQSLVVSESEILHAIAWAYDNLGLAIEGSSAVVIAALMNKRTVFSQRVCLILTGANIDQAIIHQARQHSYNPS